MWWCILNSELGFYGTNRVPVMYDAPPPWRLRKVFCTFALLLVNIFPAVAKAVPLKNLLMLGSLLPRQQFLREQWWGTLGSSRETGGAS